MSADGLADVIRRQLELFEEEQSGLIAECEAAERAYDAAGREEAEERYADYLDLVETGAEVLADMRDGFASTLSGAAAGAYELAFNRAVAERLPRFGVGIEDA